MEVTDPLGADERRRVLVNPRFNSFTPVGQGILAGVVPNAPKADKAALGESDINPATARGDATLRGGYGSSGGYGGSSDPSQLGQGRQFSREDLENIAGMLGTTPEDIQSSLGSAARSAGRGLVSAIGGIAGGLGGATLGTLAFPGAGTLAGAQLGGRAGNWAFGRAYDRVFGVGKTQEELRAEQLAEEKTIADKKAAEERSGGGLFSERGDRDFGSSELNDLADSRGFGGSNYSSGGGGFGGNDSGRDSVSGFGDSISDWSDSGFGGFGGGLSFAKGGPIPAPPGKPVPATVHGGEHVMTEDAVRGAGGGDINQGLLLMQALMKWFEQQQALGPSAQKPGPLSRVNPGMRS